MKEACGKKAVSGPRHVFGQVLEMPDVARDEFIRFRFFGNQRVPVIVNPCFLDAQALGIFQSRQGFLLGQFLELDFTGKISQPGGALVLGENHPFRVPLVVRDFHAATGHHGSASRCKQATCSPVLRRRNTSGNMAALIAADVSQYVLMNGSRALRPPPCQWLPDQAGIPWVPGRKNRRPICPA